MNFIRTKYFIVFFLFVTFSLRGIETVLPWFMGNFAEESHQEMQANSDEKSGQEKAAEELSEKEFFSHLFFDHVSNLKYILISPYVPVRNSAFEKEIFSPVYTPPPEFNIG